MKRTIFTIIFAALAFYIFAQDSISVLSDVKLVSDGSGGVETYSLIESVLGKGCIEAPDLYSVNHPGEKHIVEESDAIVGNYFLFKIHKNEDRDRDTENTDRQRNEIKSYETSANTLKGFSGETMRFHWFFKVQEGFTISKNFSHFFQLKAVNGDDDSQPIVTISGSISSDVPEFKIIHNAGNGASDKKLTSTSWTKANTGDWMEMDVIATFADKGYLKITISDLAGNVILKTEQKNIDMWRTGCTFVRPKWGIYRSLNSSTYLSEEEETAGFANFSIQKIAFVTPSSSCRIDNSVVTVFPNLVSDCVSIRFEREYSGEIEVSDLFGRISIKKCVYYENNLQIDTSKLPMGVYFVKMKNESQTFRFIKR